MPVVGRVGELQPEEDGEITMRQESPAWKAHEGNEVSKLLFKPVPFFEVSFLMVKSDVQH